jgi:dTDP-4-amino-4,6-dideoxygalactose transaminase
VPQAQSRALSERVLCLPIYPGLQRAEQDKVINTIIEECSFSNANYQSPALAQVM